MLEDKEKRKQLTRWIVGVFSICILIYLAVRHIGSIASAIAWLVDLVKPLLIGIVLALILNVPMRTIEMKLLSKMKKGRRPLAILLALVFVLSLFVGVAFLVVPKLVDAVGVIIQIAMGGIDVLAELEATTDYSKIPFGQQLAQADIDWSGLKLQLEQWLQNQGGNMVNGAMGAIGSIAGAVIRAFLSLVFSIYILAQKEKLKRQVVRLVRAWLPERLGNTLIHVADVCNGVFRQFIAGQALEAIILGSLCTIGMLILRLPYAPMIGALVGVTALIPVVGAYTGGIVGFIMIFTVDPLKAVIFVVFLVILQQLEGNLIYPRVVGSRINLSAIWVLAAVTIGGGLGGPLGMLLGVPLASAAYSLVKEATASREEKLNRNR